MKRGKECKKETSGSLKEWQQYLINASELCLDLMDGFPFRFIECELGHDGSFRASVGKRSSEYSTRLPFLAAMGSTCEQGKPNVPHWAEDDKKSEGSPFTSMFRAK
ncbi:unnamed protein product [Victoria cruziana]